MLAYQNINSYFTNHQNKSRDLLSQPRAAIETVLQASETPSGVRELTEDGVPVDTVQGILFSLLSASESCAQEWIDYLSIVGESTT